MMKNSNKYKDSLKLILVFALVLALFLPFWGDFASLQFQRYIIKKEVKRYLIHNLDHEKYSRLRFDLKEVSVKLRWEHSREFEYNGIMYDVINCDTSNGYVNYVCYKDDDETEINHEIRELIADSLKNIPINPNLRDKIDNFYKNLFSASGNNKFYPNIAKWEKVIFDENFRNILFQKPPSPPPKA